MVVVLPLKRIPIAAMDGFNPVKLDRLQPYCANLSSTKLTAFRAYRESLYARSLRFTETSEWRPVKRRKCCVRTCSSPRSVGASLEETIALDGLIDVLLRAKSQEELGKCVADNILAFDQKFWMRLANKSDSASSPDEKARVGDLAGEVMRMVEALVKKSDTQITDSASILQRIVSAAADENGEWQLPLSDDSVLAMKSEMDRNASYLDESLLATANAWMRKAADDKLDGTVVLLQQVLQLYAGKALTLGPQPSDVDDQVLEEILTSRETSWLERLESKASAGKISENSFLTAVRRKMEQTVLALPSGSNAQRIQAEYLKEVESRAETFFQDQYSP